MNKEIEIKSICIGNNYNPYYRGIIKEVNRRVKYIENKHMIE